MITDHKITDSERNQYYVKSTVGSRLLGTVEQNKNVFDRFPELIRTKFNLLIDYLSNIGIDSIVKSERIRYIRVNSDNLLEVSPDGMTWNLIVSNASIDGMNKFQRKQTVFRSTLLADSWNEKKYSLESTYPNDSYDVEIALDSTASQEQIDAYNAGLFIGSASENVLTASGDVPSTDIPIILKVVPK